MTSRELTFGFDFWLRGHLRIAVMHLSIKFRADIFIQWGVIDILPKLKMAPAAILDLFRPPKGTSLRDFTSLSYRVQKSIHGSDLCACLRKKV